MTAQTNAQRQAEYKARRIASGLVLVHQLWVHPDDVAAVKAVAAGLALKRERESRRLQLSARIRELIGP
jgi:hypothetical protein